MNKEKNFKNPQAENNHPLQLLELQQKLTRMEAELLSLRGDNQNLRSQVKTLDEQVFDLYTITQAGKVFTANPEINRLAEVLLSIVQERLGLKKCGLLLYQENQKGYQLFKAVGLPENLIGNLIYKPKEGLLSQLILAGEPFPVIDSTGKLRLEAIFYQNRLHLLESAYWIPLKAKETAIGILTVERANLNPAELNFLSLLSSQAAVAFETAGLYLTLEHYTGEMNKRMHQLTILYDVVKALNFIDDLTKLLALILDQSIEIAKAQKGSLMLIDEKTDDLVVRVVRGIDPETEAKILSGEIQCTRIPKGVGIAGKVARSGEALIINNVAESKDFMPSKASRVSNILCVPLKVYEEVIGVINITNKKEEQEFSPEDLSIISALASQAAVAINNAKLYELAATDSLTKLFIRRHFNQRLEEELRRAGRYQHPVSLLMIDIDHFKNSNDQHGHQAGDLVLVELARIFKRTIRTTDMVARYGGEEFCILLPETDYPGAEIFSERLRKEIAEHEFYFEQTPLHITISTGIAGFPAHALNMTELIRKADLALYAAKQAGRNKVKLSADFLPETKQPK